MPFLILPPPQINFFFMSQPWLAIFPFSLGFILQKCHTILFPQAEIDQIEGIVKKITFQFLIKLSFDMKRRRMIDFYEPWLQLIVYHDIKP